MIGRAWLWAAQKPAVERIVRNSALTRPVVDRFVAGSDAEAAIQVIKELNGRGIGGILDLLGEGVTDPTGADEAAASYLRLVKRIDETRVDTTVSVKLTQLGLAIDKGACIDHLRRLCAEAQVAGTAIEVDMEQSSYVDDTLDVFSTLVADFPDLRLAVQACLRRTPIDLERLAHLKPRIRLVKGAYAEPREIALQRRAEIDAQFRFLTGWLFRHGTHPAIATHDHHLISHARLVAERLQVPDDAWEVQMLYGIRRDLQAALARRGVKVRVYVPFGSAWYPYLMRRIAERPANLWFFLRALAGR